MLNRDWESKRIRLLRRVFRHATEVLLYAAVGIGISVQAAGAASPPPGLPGPPPGAGSWLAWYTDATGWHWQGTVAASASRWYRWTAIPSGVAEWRTPGGEITPWNWSPISVTPGHGTYVIAVFEAIYWYSHPQYVWSYARSGEGVGAVTTYCAYA